MEEAQWRAVVVVIVVIFFVWVVGINVLQGQGWLSHRSLAGTTAGRSGRRAFGMRTGSFLSTPGAWSSARCLAPSPLKGGVGSNTERMRWP